ncbi:hypothetical protein L1987_10465 [Smallanthus sonchifolius]|uniref:Uncharacterized protein n=1 Tax=Smallanthus sonchifolius TaxID=185202 RepID=A0ACB9JS56_9ASTR|nr:hypothetical protein L1987_10465 [Smallanthus sonchifolius]
MIIGIVAAMTSVSLLLLVFGLYMKRKRSKHGEEEGSNYNFIILSYAFVLKGPRIVHRAVKAWSLYESNRHSEIIDSSLASFGE